MHPMNNGDPKRSDTFAGQSEPKRLALLALGWLLIIASPIIGALPGPGFIILFPMGLAILIRNSRWAKRRYLTLKRRHPDYGRWTDWALRRNIARGKPRPPIPDFWGDFKRALRRSLGGRK